MARNRTLRVFAIIMLSLLALQFEMGMSLNLSPRLKETTAVSGIGGIVGNLDAVGADALTHGIMGTALAILSVGTLVLSLRSGSAGVIVIGILACLSTVLAAMTGVLFTSSGFSNDGYSAGMASMFLLTFSFHFILVAVVSVRI